MKKKTHDEYLKQVYFLHGEEYTVKGEYAGNKVCILHRHELCGYEFSMPPNSFLRPKIPCPHCSRRKNNDQYLQELKGTGFVPLEPYVTSDIKILHRHETCGYEWHVAPRNILRGNKKDICPNCFDHGKVFRRTRSEYEELISNTEYTLLGEYKNCSKKALHRHNTCGHEWMVKPRLILEGHECPVCALKKRTYTDEWYKKQLESTEYEALEPYVLAVKKILHRHKTCGHEWKTRPDSILNNIGCPLCKSSKGEKRIKKFLDKKRYIRYVPQYRINDCRVTFPLPFDFAVFYNDKLLFLIEYDGEQHFAPVKSWGGEDSFKKTKSRDNIKSSYCATHGIPLVRIPFFKLDETEEIINGYLNILCRYSVVVT